MKRKDERLEPEFANPDELMPDPRRRTITQEIPPEVPEIQETTKVPETDDEATVRARKQARQLELRR